MKVITAPNHPTQDEYDAYWPTIFMSGGITGAPNWQPEFAKMFDDIEDGLIFNPRRPEFDMRDPNNELAQIKWEAEYLEYANAVTFWFPKEAACIITMYELGRWTAEARKGNKLLYIGVEPGYRREVDVRVQTALALPDLKIVSSLEKLAEQVREWAAPK